MRKKSAHELDIAGITKAPVLPVRDNVHFPGIVSTLLVGRELSVRALQSSMRRDRLVLVVCQRELDVDEPRADDMYRIGTVSEVMQVLPMPDGTMRVVLRGLSRARIVKSHFRGGYYTADLDLLEDIPTTNPSIEALRREAIETLEQISALGKTVAPEALEVLPSVEDPGHLADLIANYLALSAGVKQELLEERDVFVRMESLVKALIAERQVLDLQSELRNRVERELGNSQRDYFLREQLRAIQTELGGEAALTDEGSELHARILSAHMPDETQERALQELKRYERSSGNSPEGMVIRSYIEALCDLPWDVRSEDRLDVRAAAKVLDRDHYGLEKVKDRILDFLAVRQVSQSLRGPILCFEGPPGVGKTSLGRSIAEALGRKFVRISLGGIRDEAEIRGHRRTYIGSMPGRLIQGIKQAGTRNPVFMLDEIDKVSRDMRGDPTSALLEALDPEQNTHFSDHYIEAPFDLSEVMFIMTANWLEAIPAPLRDRMEVIRFPSYTEEEKLRVATQYLVPRKTVEHGLDADKIIFEEAALATMIRNYTREAGVRSLEREIATCCRKTARRVAEGETTTVSISEESLRGFLGKPRFRTGIIREKDEIGAATGLVYTEFGGDVLTLEVRLLPARGTQPEIILTGNLGDVMKESALTALSYVRSLPECALPSGPSDVHLHVPEGAVPKDGPSAGVSIGTALVSAITGRAVRRDVAMTGELTLRGHVLPIGGVREKVLAALRAGITQIILPAENEVDLEDLPASAREQATFHLVHSMDEVIRIALAAPSSPAS